jgi:hypothetical protein
LLPPSLHPFPDHSGVCITSKDSILTNVSNPADEHTVQHPTDAGTLENSEEISSNGQVSYHFMQDATQLADMPSILDHTPSPGAVGDKSAAPRSRDSIRNQPRELNSSSTGGNMSGDGMLSGTTRSESGAAPDLSVPDVTIREESGSMSGPVESRSSMNTSAAAGNQRRIVWY